MSERPAVIGRYQVERQLGEGGMGVLYLAADPVLERHVALKLLRVDSVDLRRRFVREAQSAARIQHPNIVTVYDVGDHEGQLYIAMEYIDGDTLASLIRDNVPFSPIRKLDIVDEIADGLGFAHQRGIIHRDIKPANLMITRSGLVKVLDFGIARVAHKQSGEIDGPTLVGTPAYMAPEQLEGAEADARSDIYAVGLVMYELFSGRRAFAGATTADVLQMVLEARPTPIDQLVPDIDPDLARVVVKSMARLPQDRYADLQAMRKDLARARRRAMQASADDATIVVGMPVAAVFVPPKPVAAPPPPAPTRDALTPAPPPAPVPATPVEAPRPSARADGDTGEARPLGKGGVDATGSGSSAKAEGDAPARSAGQTPRPAPVDDDATIYAPVAAVAQPLPPLPAPPPAATPVTPTPAAQVVPEPPPTALIVPEPTFVDPDPTPVPSPVVAPPPRGGDSGPVPVPLPSLPVSVDAVVPRSAGRSTVEISSAVPPASAPVVPSAPVAAPVIASSQGERRSSPPRAAAVPPPAPLAAAPPPMAAPVSAAPAPVTPATAPAAVLPGPHTTARTRKGLPVAMILGGIAVLLLLFLVMALVAVRAIGGAIGGEGLSGLFTRTVEPKVVAERPAAASGEASGPVDTPPTEAAAPAASDPPATEVALDAPAAALTEPATPIAPADAPEQPAVAPRPATVPPPVSTRRVPPPVPRPASQGSTAPVVATRPVTPPPVREEAPTAREEARETPPPVREEAVRREPVAPREEALALVRAYVAARNTSHAGGIRRVWPGVDEGHLRRITSAFSAPLTLGGCAVEAAGEGRATASCTLTQPGTTGVYAPNQALTIRRTFVFDLVEQGRGWVIAGLRE